MDPALPKHGFLAIPAPAPSIPARFRLYHGGAAKRGYLVPMQPEEYLYLGDYIFASPIKQYAARYARRMYGPAARRRRTKLYVIDARYVPAGCRLIAIPASAARIDCIETRLFGLIDVMEELSWIECEMRAHHVNSTIDLLSWHSDDCRRATRNGYCDCTVLHERLFKIGAIPSSEREPGDPTRISSRGIEALNVLRARFLGSHRDKIETQEDFVHSDDNGVDDRFTSALVYAVGKFGHLDLSLEQIRAMRDLYRKEWLQTFTVAFTLAEMGRVRERAACSVNNAVNRADPILSADEGMVLMIPGPIPVLAERFCAGRRRA